MNSDIKHQSSSVFGVLHNKNLSISFLTSSTHFWIAISSYLLCASLYLIILYCVTNFTLLYPNYQYQYQYHHQFLCFYLPYCVPHCALESTSVSNYITLFIVVKTPTQIRMNEHIYQVKSRIKRHYDNVDKNTTVLYCVVNFPR